MAGLQIFGIVAGILVIYFAALIYRISRKPLQDPQLRVNVKEPPKPRPLWRCEKCGSVHQEETIRCPCQPNRTPDVVLSWEEASSLQKRLRDFGQSGYAEGMIGDAMRRARGES